jgi:hypothetical protein
VVRTPRRLAFDIETDGLLREGKDGRPKMTRVHCVVVRDVDTGEEWGYYDEPIAAEGGGYYLFPAEKNYKYGGRITDAIRHLHSATTLIPHNGVGFDIRALWELHGAELWDPEKVFDTLVVGHLIYPKIGRIDDKKGTLPNRLRGRYSLDAWGARLGGQQKDHFGEDDPDDFSALSVGLLDRCRADVKITEELFHFLAAALEKRGYTRESVVREHRFAWELAGMMHHGVPFDADAAWRLKDDTFSEMQALDDRLHAALGPVVTVLKTKTKTEPVNLNSDLQVARKLTELYGWEPTVFTPKSHRPKMDKDVVASLPDSVPVRDDLARRGSLKGALERLMGNKKRPDSGLLRLYQTREDGSTWLHPYINHNGARTGRCTHAHPNMNWPRVSSPWGPEFRSLVRAPEGWKVVGADMSGIDARMIAHYIEPFDGGAMIRTILESDLHDQNLALMQTVVPSMVRSTGKNTFYSVVYGAYPKTVGVTAGVGPATGGKIRRLLRTKVPGLDQVIAHFEEMTKAVGYIRGLDGRPLFPDAAFSAMNTAAQGGAAVVMKEATALACEEIRARGLRAYMVLHVHDEYQFLVPEEEVEEVGPVLVESIVKAGEVLGVKCPLDGEYMVGETWAESH